SCTGGNRTIAAIASACPGDAQPVADEVPFDSTRKWSALAIGRPIGTEILVLGAPDVLEPNLVAAHRVAPLARGRERAAVGERVLRPGSALRGAQIVDADSTPTLPGGLEPLGLVALRDEIRDAAAQTLRAFDTAGVQLKILSGDDPATA